MSLIFNTLSRFDLDIMCVESSHQLHCYYSLLNVSIYRLKNVKRKLRLKRRSYAWKTKSFAYISIRNAERYHQGLHIEQRSITCSKLGRGQVSKFQNHHSECSIEIILS